MPLVSIDVLRGHPADHLDAVSQVVQDGLVETLEVPEHDHFQVITEHTPRTLRYDPTYLQGDRGEGYVLIRVTLSAGRTAEAKTQFYERVVAGLGSLGVRPEDVTIVLTENQREDWSFGSGEASYLVLPRDQWR